MRLHLAQLPLLALPLVLLAVLLKLGRGPAQALEDAQLRWAAPEQRYEEVLAVDIDDAALRRLEPRLGHWPYERGVYALLLDYLREAGARLLVIDLVFAEQRSGDDSLARSLAARPDWVLAAAGLRQPLGLEASQSDTLARLSLPPGTRLPANDWPALTLPTPELLASAAPGSVGLISVPLDEDGRLRRLPLLHRVGEQQLPALPLAALMRETGSTGPLQPDARQWPLDAQGRVLLRLSKRPDAIPRLGWDELMDAALGLRDDRALRPLLRDRVIFLGSSAFFADQVLTPQGLRGGTALQAAAYAALRRGDLLRPAPWPWQALLWSLAAAPLLWAARRPRPELARQAALSALALGALLAITALGLSWQWISTPGGPLALLLLGLALSAIAQLRWDGLTQRRLAYERAVAEAANQAKSQFLANVSHEIRTPMNALLGMAELLAKTPLNEEQRRYVDAFRGAGQTLFELINDLLDISKIEAGRLSLEPAPFELEALLRRCTELLRPRAEAQGLSLLLALEPEAAGWVEGDAQRLSQVLINLLGNAIKFTREGQVMLSAAREPDGSLLLMVSDTGIGIAPSKHELIFQPFAQADGSVTRFYGGTGLGLSISRSLVQMMGGEIWLESAPGQGSRFFIRLPLPALARSAISPPEPPPLPAANELPPQHILLCEDNEVNVLLVQAMLQPEGHHITVAENGALGLQRLRERAYDLVLMDVQMPGMDGHSATRELRRLEARLGWHHVPVVALTAHAFASDVQASREAGCDDHLSKPISQSALLAALARHGRPAGRPPPGPRRPPAPALSGGPARDGAPDPHAEVFLGAWVASWDQLSSPGAVQGAARQHLVQDLLDVARRLRAPALEGAAQVLAQALAVGAPEAALAPLEAAVAREVASALAALTARPASPTGTV